jgi:flagellar motor switch/type III secretory pathway protein FliN
MSTLPSSSANDSGNGPDVLHSPQQWGPMLELPCQLTLELSIPDFTVADLLRLQTGDLLDTKWSQSSDVPVRINEQLLAWAEFEAANESLAMRITEWA